MGKMVVLSCISFSGKYKELLSNLLFALSVGGVDKEVAPRVAYLKPGSVAQRWVIIRNITAWDGHELD